MLTYRNGARRVAGPWDLSFSDASLLRDLGVARGPQFLEDPIDVAFQLLTVQWVSNSFADPRRPA